MFLQKRSYTDTFGTVTHVLAPCDADGETRLSKMKDGQKVAIQSKKVSNRSYRQLAMFFAVVKRIYECSAAQDLFADEDELRKAMLIEAGHRKIIHRLDRTSYYEAESISYKATDHERFCAIFDRAIDKACEAFNLDREELLRGV